jgi:hypothetical protein
MPKKTLEIFTDVVCPWCYVGVARAKKLAAEHDVELVYTAFPLHPDTPAGGVLLTDLFKGRGFDLEKSHAELAKLCEAEGLGWTSQPRLDSSRLAQELWPRAPTASTTRSSARTSSTRRTSAASTSSSASPSRSGSTARPRARRSRSARTARPSTATGPARDPSASRGCRRSCTATAAWWERSRSRRSRSSSASEGRASKSEAADAGSACDGYGTSIVAWAPRHVGSHSGPFGRLVV